MAGYFLLCKSLRETSSFLPSLSQGCIFFSSIFKGWLSDQVTILVRQNRSMGEHPIDIGEVALPLQGFQ